MDLGLHLISLVGTDTSRLQSEFLFSHNAVQAVRVMKDQERGGHIFNMDGAGADGNATPSFAAYGATKRCLSQLGKSLQAELSQVWEEKETRLFMPA